jgi:hypothetical protein
MKVRSLLVLGILISLFGLPTASLAEEPTLVAPAVTWYGSALHKFEARGAVEIKVLSDARAFAKRWKRWRPKEKVPSVNFTDYFVVEAVQPGGVFFLIGLILDQRGKAILNGIGVQQGVAVPRGYGYAFALFPRKGVKTVNGQKLSAQK